MTNGNYVTASNRKMINQQTTLLRAATKGDKTTVTSLLATGEVDLDETDNDGRTPLWWAASYGHDLIVHALLLTRAVDVNRSDKYGTSPLMTASMYFHSRVVSILIQKGNADVNQTDKNGVTALDYADSEEIAQMLVGTGKVEVFESRTFDHLERVSPLSWAAKRGYASIVQMILDKEEVNYNWIDACGRTPLMVAIECGYVRVVEKLVQKDGVDVNFKNGDGQTPLWIACQKGRKDIIRLILNTERVDTSQKVEGLSFHDDTFSRTVFWPQRNLWY